MNDIETILCSAIWIDNGNTYKGHYPVNITTGFVVCGYRHNHCFTTLSFMYNTNEGRVAILRNAIQGFLTSKNRFVNREEGAEIARNAEQVPSHVTKLYSEDLYKNKD